MNMLEPVQINCPCCGEPIEILVDGSVPQQAYIEDCPVCCQPLELTVCCDGQTPQVSATASHG